ncbi:MAG: hypothetical protein WC455_23540 [Dehalococcoidia bacterium]
MTDASGNIQCIQGPNGMSIPADSGNSRYQEFLVVDTDAHLCKRVSIPEPIPDPTPSDKIRIAALEDAIIALSGV